jgi:hypothetical protein
MKSYKHVSQYIPVDQLKVDISYQRFLSESHIKKLISEFDPGLVGSLIVSKRQDGYYVIDGQHRLYALRKKNISSVDCNVYFDLTPMQEARLFVAFNNNRKRLTPSEIFIGRLEAGDPAAVEIKSIVESCGLILGIHKRLSQNTIMALTTIDRIYRQLGSTDLRRLLTLLKETWDGAPESLDSHMLFGMKIFIAKAGKLFSDKDYITKMRRYEACKVLREGRSLGNPSNSIYTPYAIAILKLYNFNRNSKRIPEKILYE